MILTNNTNKNVTIPNIEKEVILRTFPGGAIALDLETTGLSPLIDKIVEFSAIKLTSSGVEFFDTLVNPGIPIPEVTKKIHGIDDEMVKNSPPIEQVLPKFMEFVGNLPLIAHNAQFDIGFISCNMHKANIPFNESSVYCSCQFSREMLFGMANYRLGTLVKELGLKDLTHHRAFDDAVACLRIYAACLQKAWSDPEKALRRVQKKSFLYKMSDFKANPELGLPQHLEPLKSKLVHQDPIEIRYRGGSKKNQWRPVRPVGLLLLPTGNVLYALCLESDLYKHYALSKISGVRELNSIDLAHWTEHIKGKKDPPS